RRWAHFWGAAGEGPQRLRWRVVVLPHDLSPSEPAELDSRFVRGFATEAGGRASHTAIMAGALEIPAVVGLGKLLTDVSGGDLVIVDGNHGLVVIDPDEETLARYEVTRRTFRSFETGLESLPDLPGETKCGARLEHSGHSEFAHDGLH